MDCRSTSVTNIFTEKHMLNLIAVAAVSLIQGATLQFPRVGAPASSNSNIVTFTGPKGVAVIQGAITKVTFGKYEAEPRIPEGGLFAQEEVHVEFRIVDTRQKDAVETKFKGVGEAHAQFDWHRDVRALGFVVEVNR